MQPRSHQQPPRRHKLTTATYRKAVARLTTGGKAMMGIRTRPNAQNSAERARRGCRRHLGTTKARSIAAVCSLLAACAWAAPARALTYSQQALPFSGLSAPSGVAV